MNAKEKIKMIISESLGITEGDKIYEYGSQDHLNELDKLIDDIRNLKSELRRGPDRKSLRKEVGKLQGAVEAIRFLREKARRSGVRKGLLEVDDE